MRYDTVPIQSSNVEIESSPSISRDCPCFNRQRKNSLVFDTNESNLCGRLRRVFCEYIDSVLGGTRERTTTTLEISLPTFVFSTRALVSIGKIHLEHTRNASTILPFLSVPSLNNLFHTSPDHNGDGSWCDSFSKWIDRPVQFRTSSLCISLRTSL